MWEWLWNKAVGRNQKNVKDELSESLKDLEETSKGSLMSLNESVSEDFKKVQKMFKEAEGEEILATQWEKVQQHCSCNNVEN